MNTDKHSLLRIIDVNANRCREATRVLEDYTRFVLDNEQFSTQLRDIRHKLTECLKPLGNLASARNVQDDIGRENISNTSTTAGVVIANFKRLQESLRSLAEYTKTIKPSHFYQKGLPINPDCIGKQIRTRQITIGIEKLRFNAYELEQQITFHLFPNKAFQNVRLYVLVSTDLIHKPIIEIARDVIRGGADALQLREKSMPDNVLLDMALNIRKLTMAHKVLFIVNDRVDIAHLANADGVHLGDSDIPIRQARKILGPDKIIGATSHNIKEALEAQNEGADYISVGPMFPSPTKPHLKAEGLKYIKETAQKIKIPYVAIGGINKTNLPSLLKQHKKLFKYPLKAAVSSAILGKSNPAAETKFIKKALASKTPRH
ncbi:MAG: thiamine phosphate synthase [Planctomycetes bacterium]|nr:thiamine phosphate synthase [Planctomycetota bacterium]